VLLFILSSLGFAGSEVDIPPGVTLQTYQDATGLWQETTVEGPEKETLGATADCASDKATLTEATLTVRPLVGGRSTVEIRGVASGLGGSARVEAELWAGATLVAARHGTYPISASSDLSECDGDLIVRFHMHSHLVPKDLHALITGTSLDAKLTTNLLVEETGQ
jgi:hypothetical protein